MVATWPVQWGGSRLQRERLKGAVAQTGCDPEAGSRVERLNSEERSSTVWRSRINERVAPIINAATGGGPASHRAVQETRRELARRVTIGIN